MSDVYATDEELLAFDLAEWPTAEWSIDTVRQMVRDHCSYMIDGVFVDMQTANAIATVHDAVSAETQARMFTLPVERVAAICWKAVR